MASVLTSLIVLPLISISFSALTVAELSMFTVALLVPFAITAPKATTELSFAVFEAPFASMLLVDSAFIVRLPLVLSELSPAVTLPSTVTTASLFTFA